MFYSRNADRALVLPPIVLACSSDWREFNSMEVRMHVRPLDEAAFYQIAGRLPPLPRADLH